MYLSHIDRRHLLHPHFELTWSADVAAGFASGLLLNLAIGDFFVIVAFGFLDDGEGVEGLVYVREEGRG